MSELSDLTNAIQKSSTVPEITDADRAIIGASADVGGLANLKRELEEHTSKGLQRGAEIATYGLALVPLALVIWIPERVNLIVAACLVVVGSMVLAVVQQRRAKRRARTIGAWSGLIRFRLEQLATTER